MRETTARGRRRTRRSRERNAMENVTKVQVLMFPLPPIGHLVTTVELAKILIHNHSLLSITILTPHDHPFDAPTTAPYIARISASYSPTRLRFLNLPPVHFSPTPDMRSQTIRSLFVAAHKPLVAEALKSLSTPSSPVRAFITDFFCTNLLEAAEEADVPCYLFFTSGANLLSLMLYLPTLHDQIPCEFRDCKNPIPVPGLPPVPAIDLPLVLQDRTNDAYKWFLYHAGRLRESKGIIINTFAELEPLTLKALREGLCLPNHPTPPIYTVGPLLNLDDQPAGGEGHECLRWLDKQPHGSVVFLCFGSLGAFPAHQTNEIALGLEQSGQRFLWSLRTTSHDSEPLPEGFLERTQGYGMVWPKWVPQVAVLTHPAVGGFVSHCGWNSTLESLCHGVPMVAWPLYAEQRLNALVLVRELGVALEMEMAEDGVVRAEALGSRVRALMEEEEGRRVRKRAKELKAAAMKVVEEGGSSQSSLKAAIHEILKAGVVSV
ncbi:anthocyanidin 5,3-O-glucosyltransferase [Amborella trichopoda]|nr:anthocyanidin 5,3-O-glucosyltransferase [Amborella trichopoda]|eukprot:XP_006858259.2 anthocyanidin 5,3-O-glucosyltransferase [Amborella trichopoda]